MLERAVETSIANLQFACGTSRNVTQYHPRVLLLAMIKVGTLDGHAPDSDDYILQHFRQNKKGMPGVTSEMLFTIFKRFAVALEAYNSTIPEDRPGPEYPHDPRSVQDFLELPAPRMVGWRCMRVMTRVLPPARRNGGPLAVLWFAISTIADGDLELLEDFEVITGAGDPGSREVEKILVRAGSKVQNKTVRAIICTSHGGKLANQPENLT